MIAPIKAEMTTTSPWVPSIDTGSTISFVIVLATQVNVIAPIKFIKHASKIAVRGFNAFVDTEVAIALAVS